jgi:hypothetical protein
VIRNVCSPTATRKKNKAIAMLRVYSKGQLGPECAVGQIFGQLKIAHWAVTIWAVDLNSNILNKVRVSKITESINTFRSMYIIMIKSSLLTFLKLQTQLVTKVIIPETTETES